MCVTISFQPDFFRLKNKKKKKYWLRFETWTLSRIILLNYEYRKLKLDCWLFKEYSGVKFKDGPKYSIFMGANSIQNLSNYFQMCIKRLYVLYMNIYKCQVSLKLFQETIFLKFH